MPKFSFQPTVTTTKVITARLGSAATEAGRLSDKEKGKLVKLAGPSRYDLAAVGNEIEGQITSVETATLDGFSIGGVAIESEFMDVIFDGLQATPGTGVLAVGEYVLVGTVTPKGTELPNGVLAAPRVVKATDQTAAKNSPFAWRVADLGTANSGAVGTRGVIQKV